MIGVSRPRKNRTFKGLALNERLASEGLKAVCGLALVNRRAGHADHWLEIDGVVQELYDMVAPHGVKRPMACGFRNEDLRHVIRSGRA